MQSGVVCRAALATLRKRGFIANIRRQHAASIRPIEPPYDTEKSSMESVTMDNKAFPYIRYHSARHTSENEKFNSILKTEKLDSTDKYRRILRTKMLMWVDRGHASLSLAEHWERTLLNPSDVVLQQYLRSEHELPYFLLLHILRNSDLEKEHVRTLLVHTWYRLMGYQQRDITSDMTENGADIFLPPEWHIRPWKMPPNDVPSFCQLDDKFFQGLIARFMMQARRTLPQALPSIVFLFNAYHWFTKGRLEPSSDGSAHILDSKTHKKLSRFYNHMMEKLALPPQQNPAKDMKFAWDGAKILIEQAGQYSPPLLLNQDSYRGVIRILAAARKTDREKRFAANLSTEWPPWREALDGVDEERPIEDDLSRAVLASRRMSEEGYRFDHQDWEMQITGGRDTDGTPTIATRHVAKRQKYKLQTRERAWIGTIRATRSAREAWMAFMECDKRKDQPISADMYQAVFEKLVYERRRLLRIRISDVALPGESKAVNEHTSHDLSVDELARTQPEEEMLLYSQMLFYGVLPSGGFLNFLVRNAPDVTIGIRYLKDAHLNQDALNMMLDLANFRGCDPKILDKIPYQTFYAFINLLCRFCYPQSYSPARRAAYPYQSYAPSDLYGIAKCNTPLQYAIELVRFYKPVFVPTWYSTFEGLACAGTLIAAPFSGHPQDDVLSWHVLKQVLEEFHSKRLHLDIDGFYSICRCFEKAVLSSWVPKDGFSWGMIENISENWKLEDFEEIKNVWSRMTRSTNLPFSAPRLSFSFNFRAIHAYTRLLGLAKDWKEMVNLLEWMMSHREEMDEAVLDHVNGENLRRRVFIAMKCFIEEALTEAEDQGYLKDELVGITDDGLHESVPSQKPEHEEITEEIRQSKDTDEIRQFKNLVWAEARMRFLLEHEDFWDWGGWPDDEDTKEYRGRDTRFRGSGMFKELYSV